MESRAIYNEMLEAVNAQYEESGAFPTKYDLTARFRRRGGEHVPATTVQTLADRLSKALKRYVQMKDLGLPVGVPASRPPTAGTPFRCAKTRRVATDGSTTTAHTFIFPPSWARW